MHGFLSQKSDSLSLSLNFSMNFFIYSSIYAKLKLKRSIYCCCAPVEPHHRPPHYHFLSNFPIIVFNIYFLFYFNIYTFSTLTFSSPHYLLHKYYSFSFHLPTTFYINIILLLFISPLPSTYIFSSSFSSTSFILSLLIHILLL